MSRCASIRNHVCKSGAIFLVASALALSQTTTPAPKVSEERDGQHDLDWEFGSWKAHIKRMPRPLTGSNDWVEYEGTSIVRKIWDGKANLGELEVESKTGHLQGMTLRLYEPQS